MSRQEEGIRIQVAGMCELCGGQVVWGPDEQDDDGYVCIDCDAVEDPKRKVIAMVERKEARDYHTREAYRQRAIEYNRAR